MKRTTAFTTERYIRPAQGVVARERRAVTMLEVISALAVLGALTVVCAQMLTLLRGQRTVAVRRQVALVEVQNALERLVRATTEQGDRHNQREEQSLAPPVAELLPHGRIVTRVEPMDAAGRVPAGRRLTVEIHWQLASGEPAAPVRLTTWLYARPDVDTGQSSVTGPSLPGPGVEDAP
ncbi:MAG: hypothetical protein KDA63_18270 [Planctomycetales bacterium]|nr:hypothetical protein [Planctomycetales bacterium]